jgi:hypothetical protein
VTMRSIPLHSQDQEPLLPVQVAHREAAAQPTLSDSLQRWINLVVATGLEYAKSQDEGDRKYGEGLRARLQRPWPILGISVSFRPKPEHRETHPLVEGMVRFEVPSLTSDAVQLVVDAATTHPANKRGATPKTRVTATLAAQLAADGTPTTAYKLGTLSFRREGSGLQGAVASEHHQLELQRPLGPEDLRRYDVGAALAALGAARNVVADNFDVFQPTNFAGVSLMMPSANGEPAGQSLVILPPFSR